MCEHEIDLGHDGETHYDRGESSCRGRSEACPRLNRYAQAIEHRPSSDRRSSDRVMAVISEIGRSHSDGCSSATTGLVK